MATQYTGSYATDGCVSGECAQTLSGGSSLSQGQTFARLTQNFHGGRRNRRNRRNTRNKKQRGGSADFPGSFDETLPASLHKAAYIESQDAAFAALPQFVGKYGTMSGGGRRNRQSRKHGGGLYPADITAPSMILSKSEEPAAHLNPQWYTENQVVPSYVAPGNAYAAQQAQAGYSNQINYNQKAGRRSRRNLNFWLKHQAPNKPNANTTGHNKHNNHNNHNNHGQPMIISVNTTHKTANNNNRKGFKPTVIRKRKSTRKNRK